MSNQIYNPASKNQQINQIQTTQQSNTNSGFASSTITSILKSKENKIISDLEKVKQNYVNGLAKSGINVSTDEEILLNLTKIIQYSVTFVETNGLTISKMLLTDLTSGFKLNTCLNLITDVIGSLVPNNHLVAYIEHFVSLLFPSNSSTPAPVAATTSSDTTAVQVVTPIISSKTTVQKNGSVKKGLKYMLNRSGCSSS
jgi:hypothetical protein